MNRGDAETNVNVSYGWIKPLKRLKDYDVNRRRGIEVRQWSLRRTFTAWGGGGECEYYQFSSLVNNWFDNTKINKRNLRKRQNVLYGNENENSWVVRDTGKVECCSVCSSRRSRKRSTKNEMDAVRTENDWQFYFLFWFQIVMKVLNLCILKS